MCGDEAENGMLLKNGSLPALDQLTLELPWRVAFLPDEPRQMAYSG
jgi:hypothetical protein